MSASDPLARNTLEALHGRALRRVFICAKCLVLLVKSGGRTRARTWDPLIKSQLLYQLSYASLSLEAGSAGPVLPSEARRYHAAALDVKGDRPIPPGRIQLGARASRSIAIRRPRHSITVIIADPPNETRGRGMPTTGASPITIIRLIAT